VRQWRVILLAVLALLLLVGGLTALILPSPYEGAVLYELDEEHSVRVLDAVGVLLLALGSISAWGAGAVWQRHVRAS
jgi:hypothetical protein